MDTTEAKATEAEIAAHPSSVSESELPDQSVAATIATASTVYRRKTGEELNQEESISARRRAGALVLAILGVSIIAFRKTDYDLPLAIVSEILLNAVIVLATVFWCRKRGASQTERLVIVTSSLVICVPWIADQVFRSLGFGNGLEIVMMSCLAWGAIAATVFGRQSRTIGISVICSGFLTLFTTCIADNQLTLWFAYTWGIICMWWLVANHWERVETCSAVAISKTGTHRMATIALGCLAFALVAWPISGRIPVLRQLSAEIMPTSGGSSIYDAAASSGVGDGDALVAAKDHASSFGAVETDVFLDSDQPSLFDLYSDEFGEPLRKKKVEKAQSLSPQQMSNTDGKVADANRSGSSFDTNRQRPNKRKQLKSLTSDALMFWSGRPFQRLAVERFDNFDGETWSRKDSSILGAPTSVLVGDKTWFRRSDVYKTSSLSPYVRAIPEALKFTRYKSPVVPSLESMQLWHINLIDRSDFFEITSDECLRMSGREQVPNYTVVRFVNSETDIEKLQSLVANCAPRGGENIEVDDVSLQASVGELAKRYSQGHSRSWSQIMAVVDGLRREFEVLDREDNSAQFTSKKATKSAGAKLETPDGYDLRMFLQQRRGADYHFASAAAAMLGELGYETRFVTGFYTRERPLLGGNTEAAIVAEDMHAWLEVHVGHGYWVPLEPTPGYEPPTYTASLWYFAQMAAPKVATSLGILFVVGVVLWLCRRPLFEMACRVLWLPSQLLDDRKRVAWLLTLLDWRFKLAGRSRPASEIPRNWFMLQARDLAQQESQSALAQLQQFFDEADRVWFGATSSSKQPSLSDQGRQAMRWLWHQPLTKYRLSG